MSSTPRFLRIDHLGVAVPSLDTAVPVWERILGASVERVEVVPDQGIRAAFFSVGESHFELLEPLGEGGPIARSLATRGPGIHHVCVAVADLEQALAELSEAGIRLIDATPRAGAGGRRVAFVHPAATGGVLLELVETTEVPGQGAG